MLISEEYLKLQKEAHTSKHYGVMGQKWAPYIYSLAKALETTDLLDYGCGKGGLAKELPFPIKGYDPAIKEFSEKPEPAKFVTCIDVLEHIEPDLLDNVLNHLQELTTYAGFFTISSTPSGRTLADGRNAHLIQENYRWWLPRLWERFHLFRFENQPNLSFSVIVFPLDYQEEREEKIRKWAEKSGAS